MKREEMANLEKGSLVLAKINYGPKQDGVYNRPYLILASDNDKFIVAPVSSLDGKEQLIKDHPNDNCILERTGCPPLMKECFVQVNNVKLIGPHELEGVLL